MRWSARLPASRPIGTRPLTIRAQLRRLCPGELVDSQKSALFGRETDRIVEERIGKKPLEVGADRIARAAHTALAVLARLRTLTEKPIPLARKREFDGCAVIEVYPGATLKARSPDHSGYKRLDDDGRVARNRIASGLGGQLPAEVKKVARELLARLRELLVLDWRKKAGARSQLKLAIEDALDAGLPRACSPEPYRQKCSAVFEHVYESYPERGTA